MQPVTTGEDSGNGSSLFRFGNARTAGRLRHGPLDGRAGRRLMRDLKLRRCDQDPSFGAADQIRSGDLTFAK